MPSQQFLRAANMLNSDKCNPNALAVFESDLKQFLKGYLDYDGLRLKMTRKERGFTMEITIDAHQFNNITIIP